MKRGWRKEVAPIALRIAPQEGQTMSEYAVVLSVITVAAILAYEALSLTVIDLAKAALERMP
jgi:Flp pilus assembly pilin Flp